MKLKLRIIGVFAILIVITSLVVADSSQYNASSSMVETPLLETNTIAISSLSSKKVNDNIIIEEDGEITLVNDDYSAIVAENTVEEVIVPIVYDNLTLEQLGARLENNMKGYIDGKGLFLASYSLEKGVDPYIALGIMLLETGCNGTCSNLTTMCNNVGGQKGRTNLCGSGSYASFSTLDEGIMAFINNLANNYVAKGLTTPELMNSKYAESDQWADKVNSYIVKIKQS